MHKYTKYNLEMMKAREWTGKIVRIYYETAYSRQVHHDTAYSRQVHHDTAYSRQVHHDTAYSRQIKRLMSRAQSNDIININNSIKIWSL